MRRPPQRCGYRGREREKGEGEEREGERERARERHMSTPEPLSVSLLSDHRPFAKAAAAAAARAAAARTARFECARPNRRATKTRGEEENDDDRMRGTLMQFPECVCVCVCVCVCARACVCVCMCVDVSINVGRGVSLTRCAWRVSKRQSHAARHRTRHMACVFGADSRGDRERPAEAQTGRGETRKRRAVNSALRRSVASIAPTRERERREKRGRKGDRGRNDEHGP